MNQLYPFEGKYFRLGDVQMHYLDEGSGPPVLMLHGNPTWSFYFRTLIAALRLEYRCIVPDHIGCGRSDKPGDRTYEYTLERRARDVEALLEHLHITSDITLVLHDWGGMIGMTYAHWHPERIKQMIILNTAAFQLPPGKRLPWQLTVFRSPHLGPLLVRGLNLFCRGALRACAVHPLPAEVRRAYLEPYNSWANRIAILRFVQDIPLRPGDRAYDIVRQVEDGLARFAQTPMLICWGAKDFVFDDDFLDGWKKRFPHAEVHRFDNAGHYVLEDARDQIVLLVRAFLERTK